MHRRIVTIVWLLARATSSAFQQSPAYRNHAVISLHSRIFSPRILSQPLNLSATVSKGNEEVATIQILMSDTGGGHRASANALRDAFNVLHETEPSRFPLPIHCDIVDIYTIYGPFWPFNAYVPLYKIMAEYSFLWKWFYEFGATPFGLWLNDFMLELTCFQPFLQCLMRDPMKIEITGKRADMVVSVHPLCQDLPLKILNYLDTNGLSRKEGRTTPFVTVVTDLGGAHPTWFNDGVDKCFVPSAVLHQAALNRGVKDNKIVQYGLPVRRGFWRFGADYSATPEVQNEAEEMQGVHYKPSIRRRLGLLDLPTVLVVGGGDGMGRIANQATAIGEKLQKLATTSVPSAREQMYQLIVICGNNQAAVAALSPPQTVWGSCVAVDVKGFVNNMDEYMRASDILVTKAGPGTIAEAAICGLPCILSSFLPGQEEGNVPYVEDNGFGCYRGTVEGIADTIEEWLTASAVTTEGTVLKLMRECALSAARPDATLDIAIDLAEMVYKRREELKRSAKVQEVVLA